MRGDAFCLGGDLPAVHSFGRISDTAVIKLTKALLQVTPDTSATIVVSDRASFVLSESQPELDRAWAKLLTSDSYLIQKVALRSEALGLEIAYMRGRIWGQLPNGNEGWEAPTSVFIDGLRVVGPTKGTNATEVACAIIAVIKKHIMLAPPAIHGGEDLTAQASAIMNTVTETVASLVQHTADRQKDLDATRSSLEAATAKEIEAYKANLKNLHDARLAELDKRESEIAERASQLDDRENTHVRRELQKRMAAEVDDRLRTRGGMLPQSNAAFLLPIIVSILGGAILVFMLLSEAEALSAISNKLSLVVTTAGTENSAKQGAIQLLNQQSWSIQIRIVLQSVALGLLIWFALRFSANRYQTVSKWERDLHKFRLDTERAGFLVEGDLEARRMSENGLPDVLLESFSRGLFSSDHDPIDNAKAADPFSAMIGNAVKMNFGPNGVSAEIDRTGIKRARKEISADND